MNLDKPRKRKETRFDKRRGNKILNENGKVVFVKLKNIPKGCSTPRQICIKCLSVSIHKNDSNYSLKICKSCAPN